MKRCSKCGETKVVDEFYVDRARRSGRTAQCKPCRRLAERRYAERHPERLRAASERRHLKRKYGLTIESRDALLAEQGGVCAICSQEETRPATLSTDGRPLRLAIDHCHATGVVRGALCNSCNRGLGFFRDSADLLFAAALYREQWEA